MTFSSLDDILPAVRAAQRDGRPGVLLAVVRSALASAPIGARAFVADDGAVYGSLDAALLTAATRDAAAVISNEATGLRSYARTTDDTYQFAGVSGGDVDLFFEVLSRPATLVVVGCGHIAVPLAALGALLDYRVVVIDDRAQYANRERFPSADTILVGPYRDTVRALSIDAATYIVLVTRGHVHDRECLEEVLPSPARYIGMIGSKRRVRTVLEHLAGESTLVPHLSKLYSPVGLDLGAHSPAEIALSIMAQITQLRRGGSGGTLSLRGLGDRG